MKLNYDFDIYVFFGDGINRNSSKSEIKKAYISKYITFFKEINDAKGPTEESKITEQLNFLNAWYKLLKDDKKREEYNEWLYRKNEVESKKAIQKLSAQKMLLDFIAIKSEVNKAEKKLSGKDITVKSEITNISNKIISVLAKYNVQQILDNNGSDFSEEIHVENELVKLYGQRINSSIKTDNIDMNNSVKLVDEILERGFTFYNDVLKKSIVNTSIVKRSVEVNEELVDFLNGNDQNLLSSSSSSSGKNFPELEITKEFNPEPFVNEFNRNIDATQEVDLVAEKISRLNAEINQIEKEFTEEEDVILEIKSTSKPPSQPSKSIAELRKELESGSSSYDDDDLFTSSSSRKRSRPSILDEDFDFDDNNNDSYSSVPEGKQKKLDKKSRKLQEKEDKKNADILNKLMSQ